jgi:hypothetical protein
MNLGPTRRPHTDAERTARLDDWSALARDAAAHAGGPAIDPTGAFGLRAEASAVWAWPMAGQLRCKALSQLARLYAQASPVERAVLAGPMERLAEAVAEAVEAGREAAELAAAGLGGPGLGGAMTPAQPRLPYAED